MGGLEYIGMKSCIPRANGRATDDRVNSAFFVFFFFFFSKV